MRTALATLALLAPLAACGSDATPAGAPEEVTLTVVAAASLKGTFTELGEQFEADHPGVTVVLGFGGSADLVSQIQQGAPADVFASADTRNMDKLVADDLVDGTPTPFATNTLQIATPPDNPADVDELADLADPDVTVVLCAPAVPCGAAAVGVEEAAGLDIRPVSEEQSVTDVLAKVTSGEADAGLVYVTDVEAAGSKVVGVAFPESADVVNTYPIAALSDSEHLALAREFADLVAGADGRAVLEAAGFGAP